jgi:hypothetical protein
MGKKRLNHLAGDKTVEEFNPQELHIPGPLNPNKLDKEGKLEKITVIMEDQYDEICM